MNQYCRIRVGFVGVLLLLTQYVWGQSWELVMMEAQKNLQTGKYADALTASRKGLEISEKMCGKTCFYYQVSLGMVANSQAQLGQFSESRESFEQLITIIEKQNQGTSSNMLYTKSVGVLASVYRMLGLYALAEDRYKSALQLLEKSVGIEDREYLLALSHLGNLYAETKRPTQAIAIYERVLKYEKKDQIYVYTLDNLAKIYVNDLGQFARAEELFWEANRLTIDLFGKESMDYVSSLTSLGQFYDSVGLGEQAESYYRTALRKLDSIAPDNASEHAFAQLCLANLSIEARRFKTADSLLQLVEPLYRAEFGRTSSRYGEITAAFIRLYTTQFRYAEAESYIKENLKLTTDVNIDEDWYTLSWLGKIYAESNQYAKADSAYRKALPLMAEKLGRSHVSYMNAFYCYTQLATQFNQSLADSLLTDVQRLKINHHRQQAQFLSESERAKLQLDMEKFFHFMVYFYATQRNEFRSSTELMLNTSLYLKGNLLQNAEALRHRGATSGDTATTNLLTRWQNQKRLLGYYEQQPQKARHINLVEERARANELEKELIRRDKNFGRFLEDNELVWTSVQQQLKPDEVAIEFIHFNYYKDFHHSDSIQYAALLIRPDMPKPTLVLLTSEQKLKGLLGRYKSRGGNLYSVRSSEILRTNALNGKTLYQQLWQPLMSHLAGKKTIYFSPSGLLHRIAFAALPLPDGSRLIDHFNLHQFLSLRALAHPQLLVSPTDSWRGVAFGGVNYRSASPIELTKINAPLKPHQLNTYRRSLTRALKQQPLPYLPGTLQEVEAIRSIWSTHSVPFQIYTQNEANEEAFKALNGLAAPTIIHIATHGFFFSAHKTASNDTDPFSVGTHLRAAEDPLVRSGLMLAGADRSWLGGQPEEGEEDGILTAYEIAQMDLSKTELVVLSACETALGDIVGSEGVYGLQRAFKLAGAKRLIMALWKVPDRETTEFMTAFYKAWQPGVAARAAFRTAQQTLRKRFSTDPHKWAAFVLVE